MGRTGVPAPVPCRLERVVAIVGRYWDGKQPAIIYLTQGRFKVIDLMNEGQKTQDFFSNFSDSYFSLADYQVFLLDHKLSRAPRRYNGLARKVGTKYA